MPDNPIEQEIDEIIVGIQTEWEHGCMGSIESYRQQFLRAIKEHTYLYINPDARPNSQSAKPRLCCDRSLQQAFKSVEETNHDTKPN